METRPAPSLSLSASRRGLPLPLRLSASQRAGKDPARPLSRPLSFLADGEPGDRQDRAQGARRRERPVPLRPRPGLSRAPADLIGETKKGETPPGASLSLSAWARSLLSSQPPRSPSQPLPLMETKEETAPEIINR